MPDRLGRLLFEFAARIRRYRNLEMARVESAAKLSEREVAILEFISSKGQATFGEVAKELIASDLPKTSASALSQTISALFTDQGLVEKRLNPQDQRQPIITLTDKGKTILDAVREVRIKVLTKVKASMELSESDALILEQAWARGIVNFDKILAKESH